MFETLFFQHSATQAVIVVSLISAIGLIFGKVKVWGVSLGVTPTLDVLSKLIVMILMYFGRVGILTVTYAVMVNLSKKNMGGITYPEANMLVG